MLTVLLVPILGGMLIVACDHYGGKISRRGNITISITNARNIVLALRQYSLDHGGRYPDSQLRDPKSANEVFRVLFKEGITDDELIFGSPVSPFKPDGRIGSKPDFARALEPGENHWAMTPGLEDSAGGSIPLIYENPAVASWPPKWNADIKGKPVRGRTWSNGIIIAMNDSSVAVQPLEAKQGSAVTLKKLEDGKNLFERANGDAKSPGWRILDVEAPSK